jgi:hypothetical protein
MRILRLDLCLADDVEAQTWFVYPLTQVESNYERFFRAIREGASLEPSFAHAADSRRGPVSSGQRYGFGPEPTHSQTVENSR